MTQSVYMAGLLVGSVVFSILSDHFGRKIGIFVSIFVMVSILHIISLYMAAVGKTDNKMSHCLDWRIEVISHLGRRQGKDCHLKKLVWISTSITVSLCVAQIAKYYTFPFFFHILTNYSFCIRVAACKREKAFCHIVNKLLSRIFGRSMTNLMQQFYRHSQTTKPHRIRMTKQNRVSLLCIPLTALKKMVYQPHQAFQFATSVTGFQQINQWLRLKPSIIPLTGLRLTDNIYDFVLCYIYRLLVV